jgi:hypothetical protein
MPIDQPPRIEVAKPPQWELPPIVSLRVRAAQYQPRATRNFENPLGSARSAVEFVVTLKAPMPVRAVGPVLWVGEVRLTESEALDQEGKQLRFWSFDSSRLKAGAPIVMTWMGEQPPKRIKSKFKFEKID